MEGVCFPRIGDAVREDETVLSVDKVLHGLKGAFFEEFPLLHFRLHDFGEGVLVRGFGGSAQKVFVVVGTLRGGEENVVTVGNLDASLILAWIGGRMAKEWLEVMREK